MGAAGLTSSSFEMASKGGSGVALNLDHVPVREDGMSAYEIMLSESQERMLMVLKPGREAEAKAIFDKWDLDFAVVGELTDSGRMVIQKGGEQVCDLPIDPLAEAAPEYDRPWEPTPALPEVDPAAVEAHDPGRALETLLACPDLCSRRWVWEQYDHMVGASTVQRPGGDAGMVRIQGTDKALAVTVDCTPRYVLADPVQGGRQAVAEAYRNITATGAQPLAVTDNMNFGNPEKPRVMGQFVGACQGMAEACTALATPVVSGNVSLYNETGETAILPTPAIGGVGLLDDLSAMATIAFKAGDEAIVLLGETHGHLGQSLYLRELCGREDGPPPPVDLDAERRTGDFVRGLIRGGQVTACHDVSDGGLLVALAEMALAGDQGATVEPPEHTPGHAWLFGEDQGRYLVTATQAGDILQAAHAAGVPAYAVGRTGGDALKVAGGSSISLSQMRAKHEGWLPAYMSAAD
jgi:phosphoribosylformylglycinamidine synthase